MGNKLNLRPFSGANRLEAQLDEFLDLVSERAAFSIAPD